MARYADISTIVQQPVEKRCGWGRGGVCKGDIMESGRQGRTACLDLLAFGISVVKP